MGEDEEVYGFNDMLSCGGVQERLERGFCLLLVFKDIHSAYKKE